VTTEKVADGSLRRADFAEGQLPVGAQGPKGDTGQPGTTGPTGDTGPPGRSALETLHSGETIRGVWSVSDSGGSSTSHTDAVTFPIPAPAPVDSRHVVVYGNDTVVGDGCSGTAAAPVASPGYVCAYFGSVAGTSNAAGYGSSSTLAGGVATGDGSPYGFLILIEGTNYHANGSWAYTAP
jgi:hypothetical protein